MFMLVLGCALLSGPPLLVMEPCLADRDCRPTALYNQYFEKERHPSSAETLLQACADAGIPEAEARSVVEDESKGLQEVKMLIREQGGNGVDAVPYMIIEGKRRDFTLEGCKEVAEYVKTLEQVIKESS